MAPKGSRTANWGAHFTTRATDRGLEAAAAVARIGDALPVLEMTPADEDRPLFDPLVPTGNAVAGFHDSNNWMKSRVVTGAS